MKKGTLIHKDKKNSYIIIAVVFAILMTAILIFVNAAGTHVSVEPASSTLLKSNDTNADGTYIEFAGSTTPPPTASCGVGTGRTDNWDGNPNNNDGAPVCSLGAPLNDPNFFPIAAYGVSGGDAAIAVANGINMAINNASPLGNQPSWGQPSSVSAANQFNTAGLYVIGPYDHVDRTPSILGVEKVLGVAHVDEPARLNITDPAVIKSVGQRYEQEYQNITFTSHQMWYEQNNSTAHGSVARLKEMLANLTNVKKLFVGFDHYPLSYCTGFLSVYCQKYEFRDLGEQIDYHQLRAGYNRPVMSWTDIRNDKYAEFGSDFINTLDAAVWIPINHGSTFVAYFPIQPGQGFSAAASQPQTIAKVREINQLVKSLATVLNSPGVDTAKATTSGAVDLDLGGRIYNGKTYIFAVSVPRDSSTFGPTVTGTIEVRNKTTGTVKELKSGVTQQLSGGKFSTTFKAHEVKIFEVQ